MIKIVALNEESDEGSGSEEEGVTHEALEQIALAQYSKALELQRRGGDAAGDALQLLKDLLDTELLFDIKKPESGEKVADPLFNLKYLCYKNIANIHSSLGQKEEAIAAYCEAASLDDTDITLWHRLGTLCLQCDKFDMALHAFQKGYDCNPKHWPCIDKIVTLLLGLGQHNDCIAVIFDALKLDPDYLRGLVYRKHIYTEYPFILDFMTYLNPCYAWKPEKEVEFEKERGEELLKEAEIINVKLAEQIKDNTFKYTLPELKLRKPIKSLSWKSLGESLVHMHHYMTENAYSHACLLELVYLKENVEDKMDFSFEQPKSDSCEMKFDQNAETEKNLENDEPEIDNNESNKDFTENEKMESEADNAQLAMESKATDGKDQKKPQIRRRGSALSFLEQWEWCTKRRSARKKPATKQERADETIYDTLRRLIPISLTPEDLHKKKENTETLELVTGSKDMFGLLQEKKDHDVVENLKEGDYFGSALEQEDINNFIIKFNEKRCDIITILREYLITLTGKWKSKWPLDLGGWFYKANKCLGSHFDMPCYSEDNFEDLRTFTLMNLMAEEIEVNRKFLALCERNNKTHHLDIVEQIGVLMNKPQIFGDDCLAITLRHLWLKCHIHIYNKNEEFALDCLYQLLCEFEGMSEYEETFSLIVVNFTYKPIIGKAETLSWIKFLESNKRLATVISLYEVGDLEEVLSIIIDSFEHCKSMARRQEYDEMALDFAVHLSLILDCYWELGKPDSCFKWSVTCLHESLKHYFLCDPMSEQFDKWAVVIVKVLVCMEHCLKTEGCSYLDVLTETELSQAIHDVIQVIGHQLEERNYCKEIVLNTVTPWIILHYILQREEDQGRSRKIHDFDKTAPIASDEVPSALMVIFVGHEQLGKKSMCCNSEGKLLYFMLDTVIHRLRTPALSRCVELICQYLEQCVFCLFGHPSKKTKLKYLVDHNVIPHRLDWDRAQQLYEVFKPLDLPEIEGKLPCISAETEQLLQRMIALLPSECEPQKYVPEILKYIEGKTDELPTIPVLLPYKVKDIFYLLGDYYFKKDERSSMLEKSMKYNLYDIIVNNDRFESWAEIALAKATNLEVKLNSSANIKDMDYIYESSAAIRCFNRALELDSMHCNLWIEYGVFVYGLHSFCSRLLKQASESLSMEDFESLEQRKEEMLDTAQKCFTTVSQDLSGSDMQDDENDELWLHYYMLGKIAEKRNRPPKEYLDHYLQAAKHLMESNATYPTKINYSTPQHLSIEALEVHYRIHASILKYMEQHENKVILMPDGKVFQDCLDKCANGPFSSKKKTKKDVNDESDTKPQEPTPLQQQPKAQASSIFKRSFSDSGEDPTAEAKKQKLEYAAKVRRAASYDADFQALKAAIDPKDSGLDVLFKAAMIHSQEGKSLEDEHTSKVEDIETHETVVEPSKPAEIGDLDKAVKSASETTQKPNSDRSELTEKTNKAIEIKKDDMTSNSSKTNSSSSSSDSSSDDSSSDSSSNSSTDTDVTTKSSYESKPLSEVDVMKIISVCLDALEDCVSRFSQHYKALYRLAHYHFYYKKGKDIERCRDLMLASFTSRNNQKLQGLFCERKNNNFFNAIWRIPTTEVDRAGSFACHMSRCVLLSMEILKEIDDHKTLLDLSMQLAKIPDLDKKYLRDSEREELAQQAFSLCIQSLRGQLTKFSQQADLKTNDMERQALNSLMLDIYRAYQKVQKHPNSKQFTNLLVEGYKLTSLSAINENANLVDLSMRHCQSLIASLKQQATIASITQTSCGPSLKKSASKSFENSKAPPVVPLSKQDASKSAPTLPLMSAQEISAAFQNYLPMLNDSMLSQQTAAALSLSYMTNLSTLAGYTSLQNSLQNTLQNSLQNSFQSEYYKQFLASTLNANYGLQPPNKPKLGNRGKKSYNKPAGATNGTGKIQKPKNAQKSFSAPILPHSTIVKAVAPIQTVVTTTSSIPKSLPSPVLTNFSINQILPPLSTPLVSSMSSFSTSVQPAHMSSSSLTSFTSTSSGAAKPAHMTTTSTVSAALHTKPPLPHQQVSPGKTLQEKLAERQKNLPSKGSVAIQDINASISKLPSSLTVTKTNKTSTNGQSKKDVPKKPEPKRLQFEKQMAPPKNPISSSEIIILDDDD